MSNHLRRFRGAIAAPPDAPWVVAGPVRFLPASVLLWQDSATVHLVAEAVDRSDAASLRTHETAFERWADGDRADAPPSDPCSVGFRRLQVDAFDAPTGVALDGRGTASGGSSTEWEAAARFAAPAGVLLSAITVRLTSADDPEGPVSVAFVPA
jgi:hypothetical protein